MSWHPRRLLHYLAELGPGVLRLLGVRKGTVASDVVDVARDGDRVLPPEAPAAPAPPKKTG